MIRSLALVLAVSATVTLTSARAADPTPADLVQRVTDPDKATRKKAYEECARLGPKANSAVPALARIINPANPNIDTRDDANRVLWAGNALYLIGTKEAYDVLSQAQTTLSRRIGDASVAGLDIDDPAVISPRLWNLSNYFGELLSQEWPNAGINVPVEKMTPEQLRKHIDGLTERLAECRAQLKASEEALRYLQPNTVLHSYHLGMVRGLVGEVIPNLEAELAQAKRLLAAKEKK